MSLNSMKVRNALTLKPNTVPTNPENGDIYYDSGTNTFQFYQNGTFITYGASGTVTALGSAGISNKSGNYTITSPDNGRVFLADTSAGAFSFTLPAAASGFIFTIKDSKGSFSLNNCTLVRAAAESIEGFAGSFVMQATWGSWTFISDGTNWFIVAH